MRILASILMALALALLFSMLIFPEQDAGALLARSDTLTQSIDISPTVTTSVTKTFSLTLYGDVPADESFGVEYRDPTGREVPPLYFCGPETEVACTGQGTVYTETVSLPLGFNLYFRFFRGFTQSPNFEQIHDGWETLHSDMTNTAWYSFTGAAPDATPQNMPHQLPDTGAGRLAASQLTGGAVAGILLLASGYGVRRYISRRRSGQP